MPGYALNNTTTHKSEKGKDRKKEKKKTPLRLGSVYLDAMEGWINARLLYCVMP
jgi:hypothetical protein